MHLEGPAERTRLPPAPTCAKGSGVRLRKDHRRWLGKLRHSNARKQGPCLSVFLAGARPVQHCSWGNPATRPLLHVTHVQKANACQNTSTSVTQNPVLWRDLCCPSPKCHPGPRGTLTHALWLHGSDTVQMCRACTMTSEKDTSEYRERLSAGSF